MNEIFTNIIVVRHQQLLRQNNPTAEKKLQPSLPSFLRSTGSVTIMEASQAEETQMLERLISQLNAHLSTLGPVGNVNPQKMRSKL